MAKYSMKKDGKEVGSASTYAAPHTMDAKPVKVTEGSGRRIVTDTIERDWQPLDGVAIGASKGVKTSGIKMRGTGAATKGVKARGPMG